MKIHRSNLITALNTAIEAQRRSEVQTGRITTDSAMLAGWVVTRDAISDGDPVEFYGYTRPLVEQIEGDGSGDRESERLTYSAILHAAIRDKKEIEFMECLFDGGSVTMNTTGNLVFATKNRLEQLGGVRLADVFPDGLHYPLTADETDKLHTALEPDAVEAWFDKLQKGGQPYATLAHCPNCWTWFLFETVGKHFSGDCLKPDEPTDYKSAYQYYRMMYERLLGKHGLSSFDNSKPDEPASVSPAECECQHWWEDFPTPFVTHHYLCDGHGNRKIEPEPVLPGDCGCQEWEWLYETDRLLSNAHHPECDTFGRLKSDMSNHKVAPDTAGKNDLIAEAEHEPVGIDGGKIGYCPEHHAPILSTFNGCYVCKSLEEKEMGYRIITEGRIQGGDQCHTEGGGWITCEQRSIGLAITSPSVFQYRRPIPDDTPSLSLLICDLTDCCVVKVEQGNMPELEIEGHAWYFPDANSGRLRSARIDADFEQVKAAIDALVGEDEKPLPRIEREGPSLVGSELFAVYHEYGSFNVDEMTYDLYSKLAGKPLPIWSPKPKGVWTQLLPRREELENGGYSELAYPDLPIRAWRFTA